MGGAEVVEVEVVAMGGEEWEEVDMEGEEWEDMGAEEDMVEAIEEDMEEDMEEDTAAAGITDMVPVGFPMPGSLHTGIHLIRSLSRKNPLPYSVQRTSTAPIVAVRF